MMSSRRHGIIIVTIPKVQISFSGRECKMKSMLYIQKLCKIYHNTRHPMYPYSLNSTTLPMQKHKKRTPPNLTNQTQAIGTSSPNGHPAAPHSPSPRTHSPTSSTSSLPSLSPFPWMCGKYPILPSVSQQPPCSSLVRGLISMSLHEEEIWM